MRDKLRAWFVHNANVAFHVTPAGNAGLTRPRPGSPITARRALRRATLASVSAPIHRIRTHVEH